MYWCMPNCRGTHIMMSLHVSELPPITSILCTSIPAFCMLRSWIRRRHLPTWLSSLLPECFNLWIRTHRLPPCLSLHVGVGVATKVLCQQFWSRRRGRRSVRRDNQAVTVTATLSSSIFVSRTVWSHLSSAFSTIFSLELATNLRRSFHNQRED